MARSSAQDAARTARRVLRVAIRAFAQDGFAAVTLDDVAAAAGVTRGAVYHHYRNKVGLFRAAADHLQAEVAAAVVSAAQDAGADPVERLRAGSHAFLTSITAGPAVRVLLLDGPAVLGWQQWRELDAEHSGAHLRQVLREVGLDADLLEATVAHLSGAMNEAALWLAQHPEDPGAARAAHQVLDRILAAAVPPGRHEA